MHAVSLHTQQHAPPTCEPCAQRRRLGGAKARRLLQGGQARGLRPTAALGQLGALQQHLLLHMRLVLLQVRSVLLL